MEKRLGRLSAGDLTCAMWVALCFGLTSAAYFSWVDRLVTLAGGGLTDWLSMVAGYLMQAAGMGLVVLIARREPELDLRRRFMPAVALYAALTVPALLSNTLAGAASFGLLTQLMYGLIAGLYLYAIGTTVQADARGRVFGIGYAVSTVAVGLLGLVGSGSLIRGRHVLPVYLALSALAAWVAGRVRAAQDADAGAGEPPAADAREEGGLALACAVVVLLSAVKNLGFGFPSADIAAGLIPELSRIPYAVGLAAAGFINDRSRRQGMLCTLAALVLPFLMLGLTGEPVPAAICWGLDYLFYGFFSVFRAVLFLDLAQRTRRWWLAPMGLLLGRLGDIAGTGLNLLIGEHKVLLVAATALLFFPTAGLFYRLYRRLYEPRAARVRSEAEVFEAFCLHNDLSAREREVLRMIVAERSNGEIAEALFITESTVKYHVRNVLQKTGCKNRGELQRKYTLALYPGLQAGAAERI